MSSRDRNLIRYMGSPWFAAIVTFLSFFAALIGSLYTNEIKTALPPILKSGPLQQPVAWFWCLAIAAALLFWVAQHANNKQQQETEHRRIDAEEKLIAKTQDLEKLLLTLPPTDFLETFRETHNYTYRAFADALLSQAVPAQDPPLEEVIRSVLFYILVMLKKFEANPKMPMYSANFMLFRPIDSLDEKQMSKLKGSLQFVPKETDIGQLKGVLDIVVNLSTTSEMKKAEADGSLREFALPVPLSHRTKDEKRWKVLPGAPLAFCTNEIRGCINTQELTEWCRKSGDFSPSIIAELEAYFNSDEGRDIRSFVSIPLTLNEQSEPLGVLNIHSNMPDLLAAREPERHLWPLFSPYQLVLTDLIEVWIRTDGQNGGNADAG